jgi:hypothetical protein
MNSFNINNVTNLNGTAVASIGGSSWSQYSATQDVNLNGYSLYNIASLFTANLYTNQTTTISSNVATNYVIPLHNYFQETDTFNIVKGLVPFEQLIRVPTTSLRFNSQGGFKRYSVSFQFSGEAQNPSLTAENTSNIYYYCSLFNSNTSEIVNGNTINDTYSLTYAQSDLTPTKFSFSYSDVFDLTSYSWATNHTIYPYLYAKTNNDILYKFINIKMNLTMSPIILTSI